MGTTPVWAFPYPEPTDPINAGADNIKALATAVETKIRLAAGTLSINVQGTANPWTAAVTFPAGRFSTAPIVSVTPLGPDGRNYTASASGQSATGMTVAATRVSAGTQVVHWIAAQIG